ncbi:MAG: hypothetical protein NTZ93_04185 [Candidatus Beckwithbacteria bacterium]|nr:hypothetical protein [Candidatus Beckwithbacteria bacterium]
MNDKGIETSEVIKGAAKHLKEATLPTGIKKETETGEVKFEETRQEGEIFDRAFNNEPLTVADVRSYLKASKKELAVLEKIPDSVKFSLGPDVAGQNKRKEQLREILKIIGVEEVQVEGENFTADEIWDAVCYEFRSEHNFSGKKDEAKDLLGDVRGAVIKKQAKKIIDKTGNNNAENILNIATSLVVEEVDPLSLREKNLRRPFKETLFTPHEKQKIPNVAEAIVRDVIVTKKNLERWQVVNTFLTQIAEGRTGQIKEPEPGDRQLPYQLSFDESRKRMVIDHLPDKDVDEICEVLKDTDMMVGRAQDQVMQGVQGYWGWTAEVVIRRAHEIWSETSKSIQKDLSGMMTHLSEVGHGHFIAAALEIPDVGKILAMLDWYQQRDSATNRPLPMPEVTDVVKNVKKKAKLLGIPSSKVDLAFFLTQLLQTGHWIGKVGLKHRNILERYGLEEEATGLPIGTFDKILPQVGGRVREDMPKIDMEDMSREERINFELQVRDFSETVVGTCLDWSAEHLKRIPDAALQEDVLYRMKVGEPPLYRPPEEIDERIVAAIHEKQMLFKEDPKKPLAKTKELLEESYLHREQYRWLFVWASFGGLYNEWKGKTGVEGNWARRLGKQAVEKQYLNPIKQEDRQALIDWLQNKDFAKATLAEAGMDPGWITDEVIVELFTDDNMRRVNEFRQGIMESQNEKVKLSDLKKEIEVFSRPGNRLTPEERNKFLATALEFVLRDKRTWNVDMGINNSRFSDPNLNLAREVREKSEFGANEAHILVTMEDFRQQIHNTFGKILGNMALIHLEQEFPDVKKYMAELTNAYGDDGLTRQGTLTGPWMAMETSLSTRAGNMITDYYLLGYEATGGDWVTSQQHLYDRFDINRIFHEHFHPVVGTARRIYGIQTYENWIDDILAKQRAVPSNALDTRWERLFISMPDLQKIITLLIIGGEGKGMYSHCVKRILKNGGEGEIILRDESDYWLARTEREAAKLYHPATIATLRQLIEQASHGDTDVDKVKKAMDSYVAAGFLRRIENDKFEKIGLGDLFSVEFDTYYVDAKRTVMQRQRFPIDFMIDFGQQVRGVSVEFAAANEYPYPTMFWVHAKTPGFWDKEIENLERTIKDLDKKQPNYQETLNELEKTLKDYGKNKKQCDELWEGIEEQLVDGKKIEKKMGFREMMLTGWLIDPETPESEMPKTYWQWRNNALSYFGLDEEGLAKKYEGGFSEYLSDYFDKLKIRIAETGDQFLGRELELRERVLRREGRKMAKKLKDDPAPKVLEQVLRAYSEWLLEDIGEKIGRWKEKGVFLSDKLKLRASVEQHHIDGKITKDVRDKILQEILSIPYRDIKGGISLNYAVNKDWFSLPATVIDFVAGLFDKQNKRANNTSYQYFLTAIKGTPAGYGLSLSMLPAATKIISSAVSTLPTILSSHSINIGVKILAVTNPAWSLFWQVQLVSIGFALGVKGINWLTGWRRDETTNKWIHGPCVADSDSTIYCKERLGH